MKSLVGYLYKNEIHGKDRQSRTKNITESNKLHEMGCPTD